MHGHVAGTSQKKDKWEINVKLGYLNSLKAVPFPEKQYRKVWQTDPISDRPS